ncbi:ion transporter [Cryobacterium sp. Hh7]|uniref:potassium channel family protein n=1 Tax=Cryobacterium sp. Hh7 TaxID=1259159 RepID=UPI001068E34A|nr:potassium channel family protein [Cryobacterium sp. Hh7]TFD53495.1 ion transporter [Cryobacterium sp. Hh7]
MTQSRWQHLSEWPLTVAAVIFLVAYTWEVIGDLHGAAYIATETVITATWAIFALDYLVNLTLAPNRWKWFYTHVFDLLIVVLPLLRPLRLLRLVTLLAVLQRTAGAAFRGRVVIYVAGATALLVFVAALAVLDSERTTSDPTITNFGDALWWAFVTVTTVGYGDFAPVTTQGRLIAGGLMLGGVALLGVVTATLASWIVERVSQQEEDKQAATRGEIRALEEQLAQLQHTLNERASTAKLAVNDR